jgi:excisionase family DNA binding protein
MTTFKSKMKEIIILEGITKEELFQRIQTAVDNAVSSRLQGFIDELSKVKKVKYITRQETASLLKISLPTLNEWTKLGILTSIKIGTRVLYKSDIVETHNNNLQNGMRKKHHRY